MVSTPATGHTWETTSEADCENDGEKECTVCHATEVIPSASAHNYVVQTKTTCEEKGKGTCPRCKDEVTIPV